MEKDCGMWINILSHMLKKRMNANTQSLGITGVQSHVMHYILVKCADGPVFQRDVERAFSLSRSTATGILQLMEKKRSDPTGKRGQRRTLKKPDSNQEGGRPGCTDRRVSPSDRAATHARAFRRAAGAIYSDR